MTKNQLDLRYYNISFVQMSTTLTLWTTPSTNACAQHHTPSSSETNRPTPASPSQPRDHSGPMRRTHITCSTGSFPSPATPPHRYNAGSGLTPAPCFIRPLFSALGRTRRKIDEDSCSGLVRRAITLRGGTALGISSSSLIQRSVLLWTHKGGERRGVLPQPLSAG